MSKITIIEGNSNDKDNVRNYMVKGEPGADGVSPSASVTRGTNKATIEVTDAEGTTSSDVFDGVSPIVEVSKTNGVTTITITDAEGTHTATINDGEVSNSSLNTTLDNRVGVNSNLNTTTKDTIVGAINEVNGDTSALDTRIGDNSDLETTTTSTIVGAINEVNSNLSNLGDNIYLKDNFALVSGSISLQGMEEDTFGISLPTGWTDSNCFIIGVKYTKNNSSPSYTSYDDYIKHVQITPNTSNARVHIYNYQSNAATYNVTLLVLKYSD